MTDSGILPAPFCPFPNPGVRLAPAGKLNLLVLKTALGKSTYLVLRALECRRQLQTGGERGYMHRASWCCCRRGLYRAETAEPRSFRSWLSVVLV